MISVKDLCKSFNGLQVLKGISVEISKGDVVCVIGPSGSGKSTLLRCINLLETPSSGEILFQGRQTGIDGGDGLKCFLFHWCNGEKMGQI